MHFCKQGECLFILNTQSCEYPIMCELKKKWFVFTWLGDKTEALIYSQTKWTFKLVGDNLLGKE